MSSFGSCGVNGGVQETEFAQVNSLELIMLVF